MITIKILLAILLSISCVFTYLGIREYKIWTKSEETETLSIFERVTVKFISLILFLCLSFMIISSFILVFSEITVKLPF